MKLTTVTAAFLGALFLANSTGATIADERISICGFTAAQTNNGDAKFPHFIQLNGATGGTTLGLNPVTGFESSYAFDEVLRHRVATLSRSELRQISKPDIAWSIEKYKVVEGVSLRVRRLIVPASMVTESATARHYTAPPVGHVVAMFTPAGSEIFSTPEGPYDSLIGAISSSGHAFGGAHRMAADKEPTSKSQLPGYRSICQQRSTNGQAN